ncbi:MAG: twin-arginine translocase subunit TatC [Anaerolineales bacterium]|nr:twin-arginine translocase subunit TatC [Anaerolineales bacterium]
MRKFFAGAWRVIAFPFLLIFNIIAFPFRALHRRFPRFFPALWRVISFPFRLIFNIIAFPFRALYRRFPKFFDGLWKVVSFPFRLIFNIVAFPFRAVKRFNKFLNTEPEERPLTDVFVDLVSDQDTRQMMWNQVEALRGHLLRSVLALILTICVSFFFTQQFVEFLSQPIGGLSQLKAIEATESIGVFMKAALFLGIALAIPYIAMEIWRFVAPGLRSHERKISLVGIPLAGFLFLSGAAFTFYIMLPAALPFLINFMGIKTELRPDSYFSFVTGLMFWVGLSFEFPLVIYVLSALGFIEPKVLAQQWRLAVVIITIVAAAITPTVDPINQGLVMAPMILLYFISIGLSYIAYAGRKRNEKE